MHTCVLHRIFTLNFFFILSIIFFQKKNYVAEHKKTKKRYLTKNMNWVFIFFAALFCVSIVFLLMQIVLAILESSRQRYILFGTLLSVFLLLLAMIQKSGPTRSQKIEQENAHK